MFIDCTNVQNRRSKVDDRKALITRIAWYYYINNDTQQEIADRLNISRIKVTRYLKKAHELGIVEITVSLSHGCCFEAEERLKRDLDLRSVTVAPCADDEHTRANGIGIAGAAHMHRLLTARDILGVSWGSALYSVARNLHPIRREGARQIEVVQLMGGLARGAKINPEEVVKTIAEHLDARGNWLNMPAIVDSRAARDLLLNETSVVNTFRTAGRCSICMVGIGNLSEHSSLYLTGAYTRDDLHVLNRAGAVGDILSRPYDIDGRSVHSSLSERTIALSHAQFLSIPKRVAIAVGTGKVKAIIGACRGKLITELVTDERTAGQIFAYLERSA